MPVKRPLKRRTELMLESLWAVPGDNVYAVLDSARDPLLRANLSASDVRCACLYEGDVPRAIAEGAPYLVKLRRDHRFAEDLLESSSGDSYGIFASTPADFETTRRHLARLLRVTDKLEGTRAFRWYDPRVLRAHVPTCAELELRMFFGPLSAYYAEDTDAARLNVYSRRSGVYGASQVALA